MADDAHEDRFRQHEQILEGLARLLAAQHETNQRQDALNERLTAAIERLDLTQARIETLLARMLPQSENGREA
jgi:hypothetical protein